MLPSAYHQQQRHHQPAPEEAQQQMQMQAPPQQRPPCALRKCQGRFGCLCVRLPISSHETGVYRYDHARVYRFVF